MEEFESGYIGEIDLINDLGNRITDVEILRVSETNVIARGRRYGRLWLLKGLVPELRESTFGRRQLMKEFEIHSRLCHASIAHAINVENVDELGPCIVMEWVEGETLAGLLREGMLSKQERRRIMRDIVGAVEYLHRNGVVHRDLKPSNIMVRKAGGEVVIIDLGLADSDNYIELKRPAGTYGFISPEQIENGGADTSDDVYSLGVVMNELCPEMHRLANICTGPRSKRPSSALELRKLMDERNKRHRYVLYVALPALLIIAGLFGLRRISMLDEATKRSDAQVDSLIQENKRSIQYIELLSDSLSSVHSRMTDSLTIVHARMTDAEQEFKETKEYARLYDEKFREGCRSIDAIFNRFEKEMFSSADRPDPVAFQNKMQTMNQQQLQLNDRSKQVALNSGLKEDDAVRLKGELYNYFLNELTIRNEKWLKKVLPSTI